MLNGGCCLDVVVFPFSSNKVENLTISPNEQKESSSTSMYYDASGQPLILKLLIPCIFLKHWE